MCILLACSRLNQPTCYITFDKWFVYLAVLHLQVFFRCSNRYREMQKENSMLSHLKFYSHTFQGPASSKWPFDSRNGGHLYKPWNQRSRLWVQTRWLWRTWYIYIYYIYLYTCAYPVKGAISLKDLLQDYGVIDQRLGKGKDPALGGRCPVSPKDGSVGRSPGRFIRSYTTVDGWNPKQPPGMVLKPYK